MQCKECRQLLSQFLDGQLDPQRQKMMQEHLRGCPECSRALASITEMVNVMHSMQEAEPPADFLQKVNARIDSAPWWDDVLERLRGLWPRRLPMQAAAILATLVLAVYLSNQLKSSLPLRVEKNLNLEQIKTAEPLCRKAAPEKAEKKFARLERESRKKDADTASILSEDETASILDEQCLKNEVSKKGTDYYVGDKVEEMSADKGLCFRNAEEKQQQLGFSGKLKCDGMICSAPQPESGTSLNTFLADAIRTESSSGIDSGTSVLEASRVEKTSIVKKATDETIIHSRSYSLAVESKISGAAPQQMPAEEINENELSSADVTVTPLSKVVVVKLKEGNFIAANQQQRWTVSSAGRKVAQEDVLSVLEDMHVSGIEQEKIGAAGESAALFRFTIAFRQVSILLSRLEKIGEVTLVTPLPVVRPEAYASAQGGGINPKVLEEPIFVELTVEKTR